MNRSLEVDDGFHVFSQDMREVSGFAKAGGHRGGEYEKACRRMVLAGVRWLEEHPNADPVYKGFQGVYGICLEDNEDAKNLSEAIVLVCPDCSGAMHQAAISHILSVKSMGWDAYVEKMREMGRDQEDERKLISVAELKDIVERLIGYYVNLLSENIEWIDKNLEIAKEWLSLLEKNGSGDDFLSLEKKLDSEGVHHDTGWVEMKALIPFSFEILKGN